MTHYKVPVDMLLFRSKYGLRSLLDMRATVPAACFQYLYYHGEAQGVFASTVLRPRSDMARVKLKKRLTVRIYKELARNGRKLARVIRGVRMKEIGLHRCGILEIPTTHQ